MGLRCFLRRIKVLFCFQNGYSKYRASDSNTVEPALLISLRRFLCFDLCLFYPTTASSQGGYHVCFKPFHTNTNIIRLSAESISRPLSVKMRRPLSLACALFAAMICLALYLSPREPNGYSDAAGTYVKLKGIVTAKTYKCSDDGSIKLLVTIKDCSFVYGGENLAQPDFHVLLRIPVEDGNRTTADEMDENTPIGSTVLAGGKLRCYGRATNEGGFDALSYNRSSGLGDFYLSNARILSTDGKRNVLLDDLYHIRRGLAGTLDACLDEESASVMKAMLLGEKGFLTQSTKDLYQGGGIIHVLAISGLHISFIGMSIFKLLRKKLHVRRTVSCIAASSVIILYCLMTGFSVSSFRAVFMFCMQMIAKLLHRTYDFLTAITFAGAILLISEPELFYQSGFQFSFSAVLSLALLVPAFQPKKGDPDIFERTGQALSVTAGTFPVYLCTYGYWPWVSLILNPIILPLMSAVLPAGILVLLLGSIAVPLGKAAGIIPEALLTFFRALCSLAQKIPGRLEIPGSPWFGQVILFYAGLFALVLLRNRLKSWKKLVILVLLMGFLLIRNRSGCSVCIADVGQGDGILMEADGTRIMVDGGSTSKENLMRYQLKPLLYHRGVDVIDLWIITHDDSDHCSGLLEMLQDGGKSGIRIRRIVLPAVDASVKGANYQAIEKAARDSSIPISYLHAGSGIRSGKLYLYCLHPSEGYLCDQPNEYSTTLLLSYGKFTALLTGDLEEDGESDMLQYLQNNRSAVEENGGVFDADGKLQVTLLKIAHHGSSGATSEEFLNRIHASIAVISCGVDNEYHHPHRATLQRLQKAGMKWLDTRYTGEIIFETDGTRLSVQKVGGELENTN